MSAFCQTLLRLPRPGDKYLAGTLHSPRAEQIRESGSPFFLRSPAITTKAARIACPPRGSRRPFGHAAVPAKGRSRVAVTRPVSEQEAELDLGFLPGAGLRV
jgi:hypothetical protein